MDGPAGAKESSREPQPTGPGAPASGIAAWYAVVLILIGSFHLLALLAQVFSLHFLPQMTGEPSRIDALPWFVYVAGAAVVVICGTVAVARLRRVPSMVPLSLAAAILLLPICPWTVASVAWLVTAYRRERAFVRDAV